MFFDVIYLIISTHYIVQDADNKGIVNEIPQTTSGLQGKYPLIILPLFVVFIAQLEGILWYWSLRIRYLVDSA